MKNQKSKNIINNSSTIYSRVLSASQSADAPIPASGNF